MQWYSAKLLFKHKTAKEEISGYYEERIIIASINEESDLNKEIEIIAKNYADEIGCCRLVKVIDVYEMDCSGKIKSGQEIYSKYYCTNQKANEFISERYKNCKITDCEKENCKHSWYKSTDKMMSCYFCSKTKRIYAARKKSAS